jgi:hypothetical protein
MPEYSLKIGLVKSGKQEFRTMPVPFWPDLLLRHDQGCTPAIRVAGTRQARKNAIRRPFETLCARGLPGFVEIASKVLPRWAFRRLPAAYNNVSTLFAITYTFHLNDIMDRNVGYVGLFQACVRFQVALAHTDASLKISL